LVKIITYGVFGLLLRKDIGGDMRYNTQKTQERARGYKQVENKYIQNTTKKSCKDGTIANFKGFAQDKRKAMKNNMLSMQVTWNLDSHITSTTI